MQEVTTGLQQAVKEQIDSLANTQAVQTPETLENNVNRIYNELKDNPEAKTLLQTKVQEGTLPEKLVTKLKETGLLKSDINSTLSNALQRNGQSNGLAIEQTKQEVSANILRTEKSKNHTGELLKLTKCNTDELTRYLSKLDSINGTNYVDDYTQNGEWPEYVQIPKDSSVLKADGSIDWSKATDGGYTLNAEGKAIKEDFIPHSGEVIDRYGNHYGRYSSPVIEGQAYSYDERSLPYLEDLSNYHQFEVTGDFNKIEEYVDRCKDIKLKSEIEATVRKYYKRDYSRLVAYKGEVAKVHGWGSGRAIQYEFPLTVDQLSRLGLLKELN